MGFSGTLAKASPEQSETVLPTKKSLQGHFCYSFNLKMSFICDKSANVAVSMIIYLARAIVYIIIKLCNYNT